MSDFVILTDSAGDLPLEMVNALGVHILPLSFTMDGATYCDHPDHRDIHPTAVYDKLRQGVVAQTSAVNVSDYVSEIEPLLTAGKDVLILAFSSGLSSTYQSSALAVEELSAQYPQRKLFTVDTLCASLGQGLLVHLAVEQQRQGRTIEEVRDWTLNHRLSLCHQFTVDDLMFLKRGGRVSGATAMVGTMLSIKPLLHVDDEGHLISVGKCRGRHAALKGLVDAMEGTILEPATATVFISHGDCLDDAQQVADMVTARMGITDIHIGYVGPVIGAHSGPGTVALFYLGSHR